MPRRILKYFSLSCFCALFFSPDFCSQAGSSCRLPHGRPLLLTSAPSNLLAAAWAQGEPKPEPGPQPRAARASPRPLPPRAMPARPPGASPCPAERAPPPRTRPGPGSPRPGASRRPGPSLMAPPPPGAPRKDPEGNSRLSAQQPKAGQEARRAGLGPDNDARGSPRSPTLTPAPHPQPVTLEQLPAQPYAPDARHPWPQLSACTREDAREHTRRPASPQGRWGTRHRAAGRVCLPFLALCPLILLPPSGRPASHQSLRPGEGSATFHRGLHFWGRPVRSPTRPRLLSMLPQQPLPTPPAAPCPPPTPFQPKSPYRFREVASNSRSGGSSLPPRVQPHSLLGTIVARDGLWTARLELGTQGISVYSGVRGQV